MKKYYTFFLLSILIASAVTSCRKDDTTPPPSDPVFYYVGYTYNQGYTDANRRAILCIGDSIVRLSPQNRSDAVAVHVYDQDAYTVGFQHNGESRRVVYWKNETITRLGDAHRSNTGTAIYADDRGVYVAGTMYAEVQGKLAPYQYVWLNDAFVQRSGALDYSGIYAIAPYQGTLYLAGDFAQTATLWTDNSLRALSGPASGARYLNPTLDGVMVIGWRGVNAQTDAVSVWRDRANGETPERIFNNELGKRVYSMDAAMDGRDYFYVINSAENTAFVYKNDQLLYDLSKTGKVIAEAIRVYGGKVYVLGQKLSGSAATPTLWIDGEEQTLFDAGEKVYLHDFFIK